MIDTTWMKYNDRDLDKVHVLQECRLFKDQINPQRARIIITKVLFLLSQGEKFTEREIVDCFFAVTMLFQNKNAELRRMVYLFIKEAAEATGKDNAMMVTQSLMKDLTGDNPLYRANAVRVLSQVIDSSALSHIERHIRQAIVDSNPFIASSGLVSGIYLFEQAPDIVRKWASEASTALQSSHQMVQYHALLLLYRIRQHDRLAVSRMIQGLINGNLRSPLGLCQLIRYVTKLMNENISSADPKRMYEFLNNCLHNKSEMVMLEAARAICAYPNVSAGDIEPAISVLQLFLSSANLPAQRFAAVRVLNTVANKFPLCVVKCNEDLENLIHDSNRSIATLACSTVLKTASEGQIDTLKKQLATFMPEIGDEFKIIVVKVRGDR